MVEKFTKTVISKLTKDRCMQSQTLTIKLESIVTLTIRIPHQSMIGFRMPAFRKIGLVVVYGCVY